MESAEMYAATTGNQVMDEYHLWEVAAVKIPSKKEDFEGGDAEIVLQTTLVVATSRESAVALAGRSLPTNCPAKELRMFVRPFVDG